MRIPKHIGIIPDGNRRWAAGKGYTKDAGYKHGLNPGVSLVRQAKKIGVQQLTFYGFTTDNTKRPQMQVKAFQEACIAAVEKIIAENDVEILVVGNTESKYFPDELKQYTTATAIGQPKLRVNFLVNYGWKWDLEGASAGNPYKQIKSKDISRMEMIIRWGGMRRLSGFLPIQSVYSDFYVIDELWPDYKDEHFKAALDWYQKQDVTLGG